MRCGADAELYRGGAAGVLEVRISEADRQAIRWESGGRVTERVVQAGCCDNQPYVRVKGMSGARMRNCSAGSRGEATGERRPVIVYLGGERLLRQAVAGEGRGVVKDVAVLKGRRDAAPSLASRSRPWRARFHKL